MSIKCCFFPLLRRVLFSFETVGTAVYRCKWGHGMPCFVSGASGLPAGSERAGGGTGPGRQLGGGGVGFLSGYPAANVGQAGGGIGTGGGVVNICPLQRSRTDLGRR